MERSVSKTMMERSMETVMGRSMEIGGQNYGLVDGEVDGKVDGKVKL